MTVSPRIIYDGGRIWSDSLSIKECTTVYPHIICDGGPIWIDSLSIKECTTVSPHIICDGGSHQKWPKIIWLKTEQLLHNGTILSNFSSLKFTSWEGMRGGERGRERKLLIMYLPYIIWGMQASTFTLKKSTSSIPLHNFSSSMWWILA